MSSIHFKFSGPSIRRGAPLLVLAHGAGAPMDSVFMEAMAAALAVEGIPVARFEFGYMAQRRSGGARRPPSKMEVLADEYLAAVAALGAQFPGSPLVIGGKSMGGRVASLVASELFKMGTIAGCLCLGYPFHPVGRPDKLRTTHLMTMTCPTLIVQGDRDALGNHATVSRFALPVTITCAWLPDGDHDFLPRQASCNAQAQLIHCAAHSAAQFVRSHAAG